MRVLVVLLGLVAAGCHMSPEAEAEQVCTAYCLCVEPISTTLQDQCIQDQCLPQLPPVSDACLDCIYQHDQVCTELFDQCSDLCLQTQTPLLGETR